ncbi:hypothetical protein H634G_10118 [Metarhizium anisopliae BRIP 53293]|uniref:Alpha-1,2-mannosyltransferase n=1 Tax=Metarhizium anisopliae BRIP 53293 TaxID=1291518 RepID=A0A0D9NKX9_METAN|nr:hypothetical protein H634G_10118 [Metarhizium anisopliae BRIP 53293]KJK94969.1 hypothetical protein H633G_01195 [Metarhizium anisopliae BRIP 53284]
MEQNPSNAKHNVVVVFCTAAAHVLGRLLIQLLQTLEKLPWPVISTRRIPEPKSTNYSNVFPPSQRKLVACIGADVGAGDASSSNPSQHPELVLGLEEDYRLASPSRIVFSGFSVGEIRSLGSFPDYAALSEVPLPRAANDFDIATARPRPYRPLRWPYNQTMAIQKMEPDYWIELESTYEEQIRLRKSIVEKHKTDVMQAIPGSELACRELMEMVIQFLCARYPRQFMLVNGVLENKIRGTRHHIDQTDGLHFLLENVPEDFAIMLRDPETGRYKLRAGIICASTGWNLGVKMGKGLAEIHGPVPDYRSKMQLSMDRFFTKFPAGKPVQRGAWGFEVGKHLYTPPGDPHLEGMKRQDAGLRPDDIYFRVDWQTLRRLPLSGAIVFNFKAFFTPVKDLMDEPYVPSLCLKVLTESKANLREYKQVHHTEHVLTPLLSHYEKSQIERGLIEAGWEPQTLEESPFFPGWMDHFSRSLSRI